MSHARNRLAKAKATTADERKLKAALVAFTGKDASGSPTRSAS